MIHELRNTPPFIDFGFGITGKTIPRGETVTVWQSTLYNESVYQTALNAPDGEVTKISDFEYTVVYNTPGVYQLSLVVGSTIRKISLQSNTITLTVI